MNKKTFKAHLVKKREVREEANFFEDINLEEAIDNKAKTIKGLCIMGNPESKNGYTYLEKAVDTLSKMVDGALFYINHPSKSEAEDRDGVRDVQHWAGCFTNGRKENGKVRADLVVRESFWPLVVDVATMQPKGVGNSINSLVRVFKDKDGKESIVDIDTLHSVDLVSAAATTETLFESVSDDVYDEEMGDMIAMDLQLEGLLADKIKERKITRKVNDLQWEAFDVVVDILKNKQVNLQDKKAQISSVLDGLEEGINNIINGGDGDLEESTKDKIKEKENDDMDFTKLTLEEIKKERPDLVEKIEGEKKSSETIKETQAELDKAKSDLEDVKAKAEAQEKEVEDLKKEKDETSKELDTYKVKEAKSAKEAFIAKTIKDEELADEAVTKYFKEDLMTKDEEDIVKSVKDRKSLWDKDSGEVKDNGEEFVAKKEEGDKEKVSKEDATKSFIDGLK